MPRPIGKVEHTVAVGWHSGGDRRPQHRRNRRFDRLWRCAGAALCERRDVRDAAVIAELVPPVPALPGIVPILVKLPARTQRPPAPGRER